MSVKAFRSVKTLRIDKRNLRLKPVRENANGFLLFFKFVSYPRLRPFGVRRYAVGSQARILHLSGRRRIVVWDESCTSRPVLLAWGDTAS